MKLRGTGIGKKKWLKQTMCVMVMRLACMVSARHMHGHSLTFFLVFLVIEQKWGLGGKARFFLLL